MAQIKPLLISVLFLLSLLLSSSFTPARGALSYTQYRTAVSLSHSLLTRVSNLRAARGDFFGANRARGIAEKLEQGLGIGFLRLAWSVGWDYLRNYAWRELDYREAYGVVSELNELVGFLAELTRAGSAVQRAAWIGRNYDNVLRVSKSVLFRLHQVFRRSGPLKEMVETVQKEVVDGDLLRDCLELGSNDLEGLVRIVKDLASQYYSTSNHNTDDL